MMKVTVIDYFITSLLFSLSTLCVASGGAPHWAYEGSEGPNKWGSLSSDFEMCAKGRQQSPIDVTGTKVSSMYPLSFHYQANPLQLINNGHTIQNNYNRLDQGETVTIGKSTYQVKGASHYDSYFMIGPQKYSLLQFHFHTPSEHAQNGGRYPMEMHFVHANNLGALGVVGVFFEKGGHNKSLQNILDNLPDQVGKVRVSQSVSVNADSLLPSNRTFSHYSGSLTTPPCSEDVKWFVMQNPISASPQQLKKMRGIMNMNARPLQSQNWRSLLRVSP